MNFSNSPSKIRSFLKRNETLIKNLLIALCGLYGAITSAYDGYNHGGVFQLLISGFFGGMVGSLIGIALPNILSIAWAFFLSMILVFAGVILLIAGSHFFEKFLPY